MEKVLLILNGSAGKGKMRSAAYEIIEKICLKECIVTVLPISPDKGLDMKAFDDAEWEKYDRIICAGGDGTLNHTINAIMKKNISSSVSLGYIPSGSTNDFAKSIGLSEDVKRAAEVAVSGEPFCYDIGRFNDNYFNYVAAFGAFSAVSYSTSQDFKNALGHAAYVLEGINRLPENIRFNIPMKIKTDVFEEEGNYVFGAIHNATSIGGFSLNTNGSVELNDGLFEMILIKAPQNLIELSQITQGLLSGNFDSPLISFHQIKSATITSDTFVAWTLDGEYGGKAKNVEFNVIPSAIQINV